MGPFQTIKRGSRSFGVSCFFFKGRLTGLPAHFPSCQGLNAVFQPSTAKGTLQLWYRLALAGPRDVLLHPLIQVRGQCCPCTCAVAFDCASASVSCCACWSPVPQDALHRPCCSGSAVAGAAAPLLRPRPRNLRDATAGVRAHAGGRICPPQTEAWCLRLRAPRSGHTAAGSRFGPRTRMRARQPGGQCWLQG